MVTLYFTTNQSLFMSGILWLCFSDFIDEIPDSSVMQSKFKCHNTRKPQYLSKELTTFTPQFRLFRYKPRLAKSLLSNLISSRPSTLGILVDWKRFGHCDMSRGKTFMQGCQMTKFDPFLSLDCARVEGVGAQSKERKGSNFAA